MRPKTDRVAGRRLLLAPAYGLTSSLYAKAAHAGKRESGKVGYYSAGYKAQSALTFFGVHHIYASDGNIHTSGRVMLPSPFIPFMTTPDSVALLRGDATKLPTKNPSKEKAL